MFEEDDSWYSPGENGLHHALFGSSTASTKHRTSKKKQRTHKHVETTEDRCMDISEGGHTQSKDAGKKRRRLGQGELTVASRKSEGGIGDCVIPKAKRRKKRAESQQESSCKSQMKKKRRKEENTEEMHYKMSSEGPSKSPHSVQVSMATATNHDSPGSKLHSKMASKMEGARFRWLNEQLYTTTGTKAREMFEGDPKLFEVYHKGFMIQVSKWPMNPLDLVIEEVKSLPKETVIADFGCGEARLAQSVPHTVHSFDLLASNSHVTACDMAHTPLEKSSVDVCIFCLSLMGTNIADFIKEARRVLKVAGQLRICDIASRFISVDDFVRDVEVFGFERVCQEAIGKMFVSLKFKHIKQKKLPTKLPDIQLRPCTYKKR